MIEDIQFLKDLQNELNTQEIDGQAAPRYWVIMDYRNVPANEEYDNGNVQHYYNDGEHIEFNKFEDIKEYIEEHYEEEVEESETLQALLNENDFEELWEYIEDNLNDCGYFSKVFVKEEQFIMPDTMFLTKEEAKRHIELNHYHYSPKAHTYAMTAWRAPKVERLLKILETFDWDKLNMQEGDNK